MKEERLLKRQVVDRRNESHCIDLNCLHGKWMRRVRNENIENAAIVRHMTIFEFVIVLYSISGAESRFDADGMFRVVTFG